MKEARDFVDYLHDILEHADPPSSLSPLLPMPRHWRTIDGHFGP